MALGGIDPVIVFTWGTNTKINIPFLGIKDVFIPFVPIPVYLSERVFDLACDEPEQTLSASYATDGGQNFTKPDAKSTRFRIRAPKGNLYMQALLALFTTAFGFMEKMDYRISVYWDSTLVIGAVLTEFSKSTLEGTDTLSIDFTLTEVTSGTSAGTLANTSSAITAGLGSTPK